MSACAYCSRLFLGTLINPGNDIAKEFFRVPPKSDALMAVKISYEKVDFLAGKCLLSIFLPLILNIELKIRLLKKLAVLTYF